MPDYKTKEKKDKKTGILLLALVLITSAAIGVTVWAVCFRDTKPVLAPDYAPHQIEENAEDMGDGADEKLESAQGGGAVSLTYSKEVRISLEDKKAELFFGNPSKSNQDRVIQLAVHDTVIVQSGLLKPGNQVKKLELLEDAQDFLAPGGYEGKFVLLYYDPDSGEKAVLNTEIPVAITVVE